MYDGIYSVDAMIKYICVCLSLLHLSELPKTSFFGLLLLSLLLFSNLQAQGFYIDSSKVVVDTTNQQSLIETAPRRARLVLRDELGVSVSSLGDDVGDNAFSLSARVILDNTFFGIGGRFSTHGTVGYAYPKIESLQEWSFMAGLSLQISSVYVRLMPSIGHQYYTSGVVNSAVGGSSSNKYSHLSHGLEAALMGYTMRFHPASLAFGLFYSLSTNRDKRVESVGLTVQGGYILLP